MKKKKARKIVNIRYFEARGIGQFPVDMLRYDTCFISPENMEKLEQEDSWRIKWDAPVIVAFPKQYGHGGFPTEGRWKSFLWNIREITVDNIHLIDTWFTWRENKWIPYSEWVAIDPLS